MGRDVKDPNRVTGCIVRIWSSDPDLLNEIRRRFDEEEYGQSDVMRCSGIPEGPSAYMLYHERTGNLDVFGWIASIGSDLDGEVHTSTSSLRIGVELVF